MNMFTRKETSFICLGVLNRCSYNGLRNALLKRKRAAKKRDNS